jgi:putative ABC transport system permease protein
VASVIGVVSLIQGLSYSITSKFEGLGGNSLTVRSDTSFEEAIQGKQNRLTLRDFEQIVHHIDDISDVTPILFGTGGDSGTIRYQSQSTFSRVIGTRASFQDSRQIYSQIGRFITDADDRSRRRSVVVGPKLRENLKLPDDPIGEFIEIGGEWFKVVGLTEERGEMFGFSQDDYAIIPFSTGMALATDPLRQDISISFNVGDIEQIDAVKDRVTGLLRQMHELKPGQRNDFKSLQVFQKSWRNM